MKKIKLQVFVSSTYTDLIEERQIAVEAILDAGHIPAGMELFRAGKSQMKTIHKWIDNSDAYMLILGGRYGSIEKETGLSYTELEYQYALTRKMPVFAIILDDSFLHMKASQTSTDEVFEKKNRGKYEKFKAKVKEQVVKFVKNKDQISHVISRQLNDILYDPDYNLSGWIRNDSQTIQEQYNNLNKNELVVAKKYLNQKIIEKIFDSAYINYADSYIDTFEKMLLEALEQQTFIDRISRQVVISVNGEKAIITMKTHIEYINVRNSDFYRTSPIFPELEQAKSYKHLELKIDNIDYTDKIQSKVEENSNNKQFGYIVRNKYPITVNKGNVTVFHKVRYKIDIENFYQYYAVAFPCRDFDVSILLEGPDVAKYRLIVGTSEYYNVSSYTEETQHRDKSACIIRFPHWILAGSGYNFTVQREKSYKDEKLIDDSKFLSEYPPDGKIIEEGDIFEKQWTIMNNGQIEWIDRTMKCIRYVPNLFYPESNVVKIPRLKPGEKFTLKVKYYAVEEGEYSSEWKMSDKDGTILFQERRGLGVYVKVVRKGEYIPR